MSEGRWGLNIVTGYLSGEFQKFGKAQIEHDHRYVMADEFTTQMKRLWDSDENVTIDGSYWRMENAFCTPKPDNGRPILVSAASSGAGMDFAAKHCDLIFVTSPAGADIEAALEAFPAHTARVKEQAQKKGKDIRVIVNPLIICRDTEQEVAEVRKRIVEAGDGGAADGIVASQRTGDQKSWRGHQREQRFIGGNIQIFGTPQQVVDRIIQLQKTGIDGIHLSFFDFAPDLEHFGKRVLPLLKEAGLRAPMPNG
jgi:FMNH2-dependent dimethyl sulfone monooxygenase